MFKTLFLLLQVIQILDRVIRDFITSYNEKKIGEADAKYKAALEKAATQKSTLDLITAINDKLK